MRTVLLRLIAACLLATAIAVMDLTSAASGAASAAARPHALVTAAVHHDSSLPLRLLAALPRPAGPYRSYPAKPLPARAAGHRVGALQATAPAALAPATLLNFEGIGDGFSGPSGGFTVASAPPDTSGDVGPNNYVQMVNAEITVFNKSGTPIYGPVPTNSLWSGFGGGCQANNDGDGAVIYDPLADRWVLEQFSVSTTPFLLCVAVSQTPDPTGAYNRYSFSYTNFPDYPKLGAWSDGYYVTYNMFNAAGTSFLGAKACALDRTAMLSGAPATQQCFDTSASYGGLLPSDLDGTTPPPAGAPNDVVGLGATASNSLAYWKFHVDWATPASSTFTGPTELPVAAYSEACGGGTCIPQSGTSQQLDSLADRVMNRLAYRNFGDHQALVLNHSVVAGSSAGIRWYELRPDASQNLSVFQQGTYAPDSSYRWMGSAALDQSGDIALGFSVSSSSIHPQIHYTGRLAGDALGQMTQGEGTIIDGAGSQSGSGLSRWGDYSALTVDPTDGCTFWYTNQYQAVTGAFDWHTRVGTFKLPGCGAVVANDFSIAASPSTVAVDAGTTGTTTVSTATTSGSAQSVSLGVSGLPVGASGSFSPTSVTSGGSSTLTLDPGTAAPGTYALTITGTGASATHTTSVSFTINPVAANDFSIAASPSTVAVDAGTTGTTTVSTATTSGSAQTVSLAVTGLPVGATGSFSPVSVTSGASSTLTLDAGTAPPGTYPLTITGTGTSATHTTSVSFTINPVVANDFSLAASPSTLTVAAGGSGSSTVSTATTSGSAQTVSLSVTGLPAGATGSFSPASVTSGGSSTLTLSAGTASSGTYALTITGTATSGTHTTSLSFVINPPASAGIVNGGFETGTLTGWTGAGATSVVSPGHGGTYAARAGSTSPTNGDSSVTQTFTAPAGTTGLSLFAKVVCPDTITYDWARATLRDNTAGTTVTVLAKTCTNSGAWVRATAAVIAGHSYTLALISHDDNYAGDATYVLYDDATLTSTPPPPAGITNGGFETGTLSGWTSSGPSTTVVSGGHSGLDAARDGSTSPTNGTSSIVQSFTAPAAATSLSFFYKVVCPDTVTYDWATAALKDVTAGTTKTVVAKTCTNTGSWVKASASIVAGHVYTLTLSSRDDNYAGDATYTLYDDVTTQ